MRYFTLLIFALALPTLLCAQFKPSDKGLTIIVKDGTDAGYDSTVQPPGDFKFPDPIRPLGMTEAIQAGAFLERPVFGLAGFLLVFCVNDSIGGERGTLIIDGEVHYGIYRLIRQKISLDEEIPDGMRPYRLSGTVFFLGIS